MCVDFKPFGAAVSREEQSRRTRCSHAYESRSMKLLHCNCHVISAKKWRHKQLGVSGRNINFWDFHHVMIVYNPIICLKLSFSAGTWSMLIHCGYRKTERGDFCHHLGPKSLLRTHYRYWVIAYFIYSSSRSEVVRKRSILLQKRV